MCAWVQHMLLGKTRLGAREHESEIRNQLCVNANSAFPPVSPVTGFAVYSAVLQHDFGGGQVSTAGTTARAAVDGKDRECCLHSQ